jgi:hypothetical protein
MIYKIFRFWFFVVFYVLTMVSAEITSIFRVKLCTVRKRWVIYAGCKEGGNSDPGEKRGDFELGSGQQEVLIDGRPLSSQPDYITQLEKRLVY